VRLETIFSIFADGVYQQRVFNTLFGNTTVGREEPAQRFGGAGNLVLVLRLALDRPLVPGELAGFNAHPVTKNLRGGRP